MPELQMPTLPEAGLIYAVGYARVSSVAQKEDGASLETQEKAIRTYAD
ncbi:MAG TPA: recombinase family protein [Ktedonobacteraceae bacterium]|jgi:DNA invertase Pin-like site-specific DNA recombinase|nr:recombinase family protein [Ktedonobacteraceae bacterium]